VQSSLLYRLPHRTLLHPSLRRLQFTFLQPHFGQTTSVFLYCRKLQTSGDHPVRLPPLTMALASPSNCTTLEDLDTTEETSLRRYADYICRNHRCSDFPYLTPDNVEQALRDKTWYKCPRAGLAGCKCFMHKCRIRGLSVDGEGE
jgi:hypothetical protein